MKALGAVGTAYLGLVEKLSDARRAHVESHCENMTAKEFVASTHGADVAALLPNELSTEELVTMIDEPTLDASRSRLRLCKRCPPHGGACDLDDELVRGRLPIWDTEQGLHFDWCDRWPEHLLRRRLRYVGVQERHLGARFANYEPITGHQTLARAKCLRYARDFAVSTDTQNMLIVGADNGVGKTHLAVASLAACIVAKKIRSAFFVYVPEFLERMRRAIDGNAEDKQLIVRASNTDLLVLDDLAAQRTTDWVRDQLNLLSNARWSAGRPTIVTTNQDPDVIADTIGPRAASRFFGQALMVGVEGSDRRSEPSSDG